MIYRGSFETLKKHEVGDVIPLIIVGFTEYGKITDVQLLEHPTLTVPRYHVTWECDC